MEEESNNKMSKEDSASRTETLLRGASSRQSVARNRKREATTTLEKLAAKGRRTTNSRKKQSSDVPPAGIAKKKHKQRPFPGSTLSAERVASMQFQNSQTLRRKAAAEAAVAEEEKMAAEEKARRLSNSLAPSHQLLVGAATANRTKTTPRFSALSAEDVEFMQQHNSQALRGSAAAEAAATKAAVATEEILGTARARLRAGMAVEDPRAFLFARAGTESGASALSQQMRQLASPTTTARYHQQLGDPTSSLIHVHGANMPRLPPMAADPSLSTSSVVGGALQGGNGITSLGGGPRHRQLNQDNITTDQNSLAEPCEVLLAKTKANRKTNNHLTPAPKTEVKLLDKERKQQNHVKAESNKDSYAVQKLKSELQCTKELLEYFRHQAWEANKRAMIQQQQVQQVQQAGGIVDHGAEFAFKKQLVQQRVAMEDLSDRLARERCLNQELTTQLQAFRNVKTITPTTETAAEIRAEEEEEVDIAEKLAQVKEESFQVENKRLKERIQELEESLRQQEREHKAALASAGNPGVGFPTKAEVHPNVAASLHEAELAHTRNPHSMGLGVPSFANRKRAAAGMTASASPYGTNKEDESLASLVSILQKRLIATHQNLEQITTERDALIRQQREQQHNLILLDDALEQQMANNHRLSKDVHDSKQQLQDSTMKRSVLVKRFEEAYVTNDTLEGRVRELETSNLILRRRLAKVLGRTNLLGNGVPAGTTL
eukprot:CAMPEP_0194057174 /NCGR_PEP_ID=MMETSP0009_2-20130614/62566_1 /TAXON_ID=210454 /ORGANISM="Grammatophora oceanica, Strain CCMP 410" /LENGTH=719 /DNA_ID=CAMNT_0038706835 /DNA_START=33 /DNA_END=2192 /DNA_ORIENTATION=-